MWTVVAGENPKSAAVCKQGTTTPAGVAIVSDDLLALLENKGKGGSTWYELDCH